MASKRVRQNLFKEDIKALIKHRSHVEIADALNLTYENGVDGDVLEHSTRRNFLDKFLSALGWTLDDSGDMLEEARVKGASVKFMDYLGVSDGGRKPILIVEAKAWGVPFIRARDDHSGQASRHSSGGSRDGSVQLAIAAIRHIQGGGEAESSPVLSDWHKFLDQVSGYVVNLWKNHNHQVTRVALTSGRWLMVFVTPHQTFNEPVSDDKRQIQVFDLEEYLAQSDEILDLLGRQELAARVPDFLIPAQLMRHVESGDVLKVFHSLLVRYEKSGFSHLVPRPRIVVEPVVTIERKDGVLLNVMRDDEGFVVDNRPVQLAQHLSEVASKAQSLLEACSREIGHDLVAAPVADFQGFPGQGIDDRELYKKSPNGDEWLYVVGKASHFLEKSNPCVDCEFHSWRACSQIGESIGASALTSKNVRAPRNFFVDGEPNHCAHSTVVHRREERCHISVFEERSCCQGCSYKYRCWSQVELKALPCEPNHD